MTHFLDEAEFLADYMVIMSKGTLKADGSVSELKNKFREGYRIHTLHGTGYGPPPETINFLGDVLKEVIYDQTILLKCMTKGESECKKKDNILIFDGVRSSYIYTLIIRWLKTANLY